MPPDHPWRGPLRREVERPVERERTCRQCGETKPIDAFPLRSARWRERVCKRCRRARRPPRRGEWTPARKRAAVARQHRRIEAEGYAYAPRHWWGVIRASVELGYSVEHTRRLVRSGALRGMRHGKRTWRIDPASVRGYLAGRGEAEAA